MEVTIQPASLVVLQLAGDVDAVGGTACRDNAFIELDGEASVSAVNKQLRQRIGEQLGIRASKYTPSSALAHLWR